MSADIVNIEADVAAIERIPIVSSMLEVICRTTGMGFAAIARVTETKWVACQVRDEIAFGLRPGGELELETTICHEIRQNGQPVIIDHVSQDQRFSQHHTPQLYGFQSYISVPIKLRNGKFFGTLCAVDPRPAQLNNDKIIGMFKLFADLIAFHLNAQEELAISEERLKEELKTSELREQFIAVLGHDLRNPLSAISNSAQVLLATQDNEDVKALAGIIRNSSTRMSGLIGNILDFARGRLGGGLSLSRVPDCDMSKVLYQVCSEMRAAFPNREIDLRINIDEPIDCDEGRIGQLFSNLLNNALTYSKDGQPVKVIATCAAGQFVLTVTNCCEPISPHILDRIFQPFSRGDAKPGQQGLGLGLYIASEIARAHGGNLEVVSTEKETSFTFRMNTGLSAL